MVQTLEAIASEYTDVEQAQWGFVTNDLNYPMTERQYNLTWKEEKLYKNIPTEKLSNKLSEFAKRMARDYHMVACGWAARTHLTFCVMVYEPLWLCLPFADVPGIKAQY